MSENGAGYVDLSFRISDATAEEFSAVIVDSTNSTAKNPTAKSASVSTERALGILQDEVTAADQVKAVRVSGIGLVRVDANSPNITAGDGLIASANGRLVKLDTLDADEQFVYATALEDASEDDILILAVIILVVQSEGAS